MTLRGLACTPRPHLGPGTSPHPCGGWTPLLPPTCTHHSLGGLAPSVPSAPLSGLLSQSGLSYHQPGQASSLSLPVTMRIPPPQKAQTRSLVIPEHTPHYSLSDQSFLRYIIGRTTLDLSYQSFIQLLRAGQQSCLEGNHPASLKAILPTDSPFAQQTHRLPVLFEPCGGCGGWERVSSPCRSVTLATLLSVQGTKQANQHIFFPKPPPKPGHFLSFFYAGNTC